MILLVSVEATRFVTLEVIEMKIKKPYCRGRKQSQFSAFCLTHSLWCHLPESGNEIVDGMGERSLFYGGGLKETACERNVWNDAVECGGAGELFNNTFHVSDGSQRGSKSK